MRSGLKAPSDQREFRAPGERRGAQVGCAATPSQQLVGELQHLGKGWNPVLAGPVGHRPAPLELAANGLHTGIWVGEDVACAEPQRLDPLLREVRVAAIVFLDGLAVLCAVDLDAESLVAKEEV